ncbi:MAG: MBL fold metallo-hydrolase [Burkholderiales bacterium]
MFRQLFDAESSTFTYLIADDATHEAVIIDPVMEQAGRDLKLIREHGLALRFTLETHVHADHVTAAAALKQSTGAHTVVARDCGAQGYDRYLVDGDVILFGHQEIMVIATPGHTPGSVSYLWQDRVFTGDALLIGGCGRTDFQNGSAEALYRSITEKLFHLDEQTLVYPGHDYKSRRVSSIGEEKIFNSRLSGKTLPEFVALMDSLHLPDPKRIHEAVPANLVGGAAPADNDTSALPMEAGDSHARRSVSALQLADVLSNEQVLLVDVRTPEEFATLRVDGATNIPTDRLDPLLLRKSLEANTPVYCMCQTGTRSQIAVDRLRAAGFLHVIHVDGGTSAWVMAGLPVVRGASP